MSGIDGFTCRSCCLSLVLALIPAVLVAGISRKLFDVWVPGTVTAYVASLAMQLHRLPHSGGPDGR